jgi:hypothetical protein
MQHGHGPPNKAGSDSKSALLRHDLGAYTRGRICLKDSSKEFVFSFDRALFEGSAVPPQITTLHGRP